MPPQTTAPWSDVSNNQPRLSKRVTISTELLTCGYLNGNAKQSRTADSGYNCRVDTQNGLWGFCPTTVVSASDCGLAGACVDDADCSDGCGLTQSTKLTTFTCKSKSFCSTALLTFGVDQTYSYIACGNKATTDHYMISPTDATTTSTKLSSSSKTTTTSATTSSSSTGHSVLPSESEFESDPTVTATSQEESNTSDSKSNNTGPIIGGVVGGLALICGTTIAAIYLLRRNRRERHNELDQSIAQGDQPLNDINKQNWQNSGWGPQELSAERRSIIRESPAELAG